MTSHVKVEIRWNHGEQLDFYGITPRIYENNSKYGIHVGFIPGGTREFYVVPSEFNYVFVFRVFGEK